MLITCDCADADCARNGCKRERRADDIAERLLWATLDPVTCRPLDPGTYGTATVDELKEAAAEIKRLRALVKRSTPTVSTTGTFAPSRRK